MSRLDRLKEQNPNLNISIIDIIAALDPSDSYKYTEFLIKQFKNHNDYYSPNKEEFMGYLGVFLFGPDEISTLNEFERHCNANRIKNKDISTYKAFQELSNEVLVAEEKEKRKQLEKEILKIYEDDTWFILTPLSLEASKVYGANTKWCVTQEKYWNQYLTTHKLIYVLNKKTDIKTAFSRNFSTEKFQAWDQLDKEVDPLFINFIPDELFLKIRKELQKDETTGDLIGIKISEIPNDIVSRRDMTFRMWDGNRVYPGDSLVVGNNDGGITTRRGVIDTVSNDSRHDMHSDEIVTRIRTLMGNQPRQPISINPGVNYTSNVTLDNIRRSIIDQLSPTINNNPNVNYISAYDNYIDYDNVVHYNKNYLDDLP
jgi:hypothetical protein